MHCLKTSTTNNNLSINTQNWIQSYLMVDIVLTSWHQCVQVDNTLSSFTAYTTGVPQGSMSGPLLFSPYIDHLPSVDWWLMMTDLIMYANDTVLYAYRKMRKFVDWLQNFCLTLYVNIFFYKQHKRRGCPYILVNVQKKPFRHKKIKGSNTYLNDCMSSWSQPCKSTQRPLRSDTPRLKYFHFWKSDNILNCLFTFKIIYNLTATLWKKKLFLLAEKQTQGTWWPTKGESSIPKIFTATHLHKWTIGIQCGESMIMFVKLCNLVPCTLFTLNSVTNLLFPPTCTGSTGGN